ncbi:MAG TPA: acyl-CoA dehydrogenase family protein [Streptosporangiaceae bacterium]|nr:acyl-CoA dehydrogenase family protein [Streptosporangiaceae bacterium]
MDRGLYAAEHEAFRETVTTYVEREVVPNMERWEEARLVSRDAWLAAGRQGVVGLSGPADCGGGGQGDYRYRNVVLEELARVGANSLSSSFSLQDDILIPYVAALADRGQRARWLVPMCHGEMIAAIAMTEPGTGSDLKGIRTTGRKVEGGWRVSGSKTFITSGIQSDIVVVVARTSPEGGSDGFSLLVVEAGMAGFSRGRKLKKIGLNGQDTAELFFDDVFVPRENLLGTEGGGFRQLMRHLPLERLSIAATAVASADAALAWTLEYVQQRRAFGQPIADFQNTRFVLAEVATELDVTRAFVDKAVMAVGSGTLTAVEAAKAKLWATEVQHRAIDRLLQLFGGYGYMLEYPIARAYQDARVQRIFGGTNEIMKQIIGRDLIGRR